MFPMKIGEDNYNVSHKFYEKYNNINKRLLNSVGLWPQNEGQKDSFFKSSLPILYILLLCGLTLSEFYNVYLIWGNFFDILEILCNATYSFLVILKSSTFYYKRDIIVEFEKQNRKMWIVEFKDPNNRRMMIDTAKTGQKLTYIFLLIVIFTVTNCYLAPLISVFYQWKAGKSPTEFVYVLPYFVKLPLDLRQPLQHAIAYVPVTITSVYVVFSITGVDSFYFTSVQHLILHLKLLQKSLTKLGRHGCVKNNNKEWPLEALRSCIEKHKTIIKHSEILEEIYSPMILGIGVMSSISMCMVIFHAVVTKGGHNGNIALYIMYLSMEASEVLLYCWFGNALTFASSEVGFAVYNTNWYDVTIKDKKAFSTSIWIMMMRTQKPIKLTAYKFADVSLALFTSLMSTTASYFALLRSLYTN